MTRIFFLIALSSALLAQPSQDQIHSWNNSDFLRHAQWGLYAEYVESGETIIDHNGQFSLTPASGLKLLTSAAALDILGSDFRFKTTLYADGQIKDGTLQGNLLIIGGGDPALASYRIEGNTALDELMQNWRDVLTAKGIKTISGDIVGYEALYDEQSTQPNWYWIDLGNYYGAGAGALNINDNLYNLFFKPGSRIGSAADVLRTEPNIPGLTFINYMKTGAVGSGDNGYIYNGPGSFAATLRGTIPAGVNEFSIKGSIPDPALFTAQHVQDYLNKNGIPVKGIAHSGREAFDYKPENVLHETLSPTLAEIVFIVNKRSFNLYAEAIGRMAGLQAFGERGLNGAENAIEGFFEKHGLSTDGLHIYDGCGLSPANSVTPRHMVQALRIMKNHPEFEAFYNSLAVAGDPDDEGFFSNWGGGTAMANNARVKSGLINRVRSHSGYVKDSKGRLIAFSFIANNFNGSTSAINNIHKKLIIGLAEM